MHYNRCLLIFLTGEREYAPRWERFRYKDGDALEIKQENPIQETNVYRSKQLPDGSVILDKDIEWAKLEMELEFLKAKLDIKDVI